jgi:uncharacterized protein (DUF1800 family)
MVRLLCICGILLTLQVDAQEIKIFGGGHSDDVEVFSSSDLIRLGWDQEGRAENTINGTGMDAKMIEASRFLAQASLGADEKIIRHVAEIGIVNWIDEQIKVPPTSYMETMSMVYSEIYDIYIADGGDPNNFKCRPKWYHSNYAWWQMVMGGDDLLRQRIALTLSEILVVSKSRSDIENHGFAIASYYDIFVRHAFGNYADILYDVALHPAMGSYLSHLNNPKANLEENTFPDENFAREVMQLFSLGVNELNLDGSDKIGDDGMPIPAYKNEDIAGLAAAFTGLGGGGISACSDAFAPAFGLNIHHIDMTIPMMMFDEWHETGPKNIVGGYTIPGGQTGMKDIEEAIHQLFVHPNVGPFLAQRMIKFLVTSNPSPAYIARVSTVFNDNGAGVKGDMEAFIKAILLDPEARSCASLQAPDRGKMREPVLRQTHFARAMDKMTSTGNYWDTGEPLMKATTQHPMHSPSVFNFFQSDYSPSGELEQSGLVAPEFQIHNSVTSTRYFNMVDEWTSHEEIFYHWEKLPKLDKYVYLDISRLIPLAREPEVLLNQLDLLLTNGQLTQSTREILRNELEDYRDNGVEELYYRTLIALYTVMISPDYVIFK